MTEPKQRLASALRDAHEHGDHERAAREHGVDAKVLRRLLARQAARRKTTDRAVAEIVDRDA